MFDFRVVMVKKKYPPGPMFVHFKVLKRPNEASE